MRQIIYLRIDWDLDYEPDISSIFTFAELMAQEWNSLYAPPRFDGIIIQFDLERDWEKYLQFREFVLSRGGERIKALSHYVELRYSREELLQAPLIWVAVPAGAYLEVVEEFEIFEYHPPCPKCGFRRAEQVRPIWLKKTGSKNFYWVYHKRPDFEAWPLELYVVSNKVKELLKLVKATGCKFEPIFIGKGKYLTDRFWQIVIIDKIGPLIDDKGQILFKELCPVCGRINDVLDFRIIYKEGIDEWTIERPLYFPKSSYTGSDVVLWEYPDWRGRQFFCISQRIYREFLKANIKHYIPVPVYLI